MSETDVLPKGRSAEEKAQDKAEYREAFLSLLRARVKAEREHNARPRKPLNLSDSVVTFGEAFNGSFKSEVGPLPAQAPELWALQEGIRRLARMSPKFIDSITDIEDMCEEYADLLEKEDSVDPQWTMSVFNVAFDGCSFKNGGTWYA